MDAGAVQPVRTDPHPHPSPEEPFAGPGRVCGGGHGVDRAVPVRGGALRPQRGCPHYADALFETASGLTTTGATILTDVEAMPRGILFWRALTQWMGGMGVLVLFLALMPRTGAGAVHLMRAESPGPIKSKLLPHVSDTAKVLYGIYIGLTAAEIVALCLAGMDFYEAVLHSFSTISTGGFSTRNASIAAFGSPAITWIVAIFMFLSGINFSLIFISCGDTSGRRCTARSCGCIPC